MKLSPEIRYSLRKFKEKWSSNLVQLVAAWLLALGVLFFHQRFGFGIDLWILEKMYGVRGARPAPDDVVIVSIDDQTYKELSLSTKFPVPRKYIAEGLEKLVALRPRIVIIDAKLPHEPQIDPDSDKRIESALRSLPSTIWSGVLKNAGSDGSEEIVLASAEQFRGAAKMELPMTLHEVKGVMTLISDPGIPSAHLFERVPMTEALSVVGGLKVGAPLPYDLINFYGPAGVLKRVSLSTLVRSPHTELEAALGGKVVLFGHESKFFARGTLGKDEFLTPSAPRGMFGVEIHGSIVANLIDGTWLKRFPLGYEVLVLGLLVFGLAAYTFRSPVPLLIVGIWGLLGGLYVAQYALFAWGLRWSGGLGSLTLFIGVLTTVSSLYLFLRASSYKRYIDRVFDFDREREL